MNFEITNVQGVALLLAVKHNTLDANSGRGNFTLNSIKAGGSIFYTLPYIASIPNYQGVHWVGRSLVVLTEYLLCSYVIF